MGDMGQRFAERKAAREAIGKPSAEFFVGVRERGLLNTIMTEPAKEFERRYPDMRTKWEYAPLNGDNILLVQRQAQGFVVVSAKEITDNPETKDEPIRRGDMVLIAAPKEVVDELELQDALAAHEDAKLPETTYKEHVRAVRVRLKDGTVQEGRPVGQIRRTEEVHELPLANAEGEEVKK